MSDQTDTSTPEQPPKRMTTADAAKAAQDAMALAASMSEDVERLGEKVTDLDARLGELRGAAGATSADVDLTAFVTRDQVDGRVHEALAPLHDELHEIRHRTPLVSGTDNLSGILARLEDAERKVAGLDAAGISVQVAQEMHPALSDLRRRMGAAEGELRGITDAGAVTLGEDHISDQVELHVREQLNAATRLIQDQNAEYVRHALDNTHGRLQVVESWAQRQLDHQSAAVETPGAPTSRGTGAQRKVLELMRTVTSLGKDHQADLGTGGRFMFRSVDDAMDAVGHAMRTVGLIISPSILKDETTQNPITKRGEGRNGGTYENTVIWTTTKLTIRYTFTDPDDGSTHQFEMVGEGRDASDKSTSKASSMAIKYGLLQGLMIPVNGLDDSDAAPPQYMESEGQQRPSGTKSDTERVDGERAARAAEQPPAEPSQQQKAQRAGEALEAIRNVHRVTGGHQAQYDRLVQIMNRVHNEGLMDFEVQNSTLNQHGQAALATLRMSAEPPASIPDESDGY